MRQIEQKMLKALKNDKNFTNSNTQVDCADPLIADIYLHGNHIASVCQVTHKAKANLATFKNWPTKTTTSRLRALGIAASIKKGQPCIDGIPI